MTQTNLRLAWMSPYSRASDVAAFSRNLLPHLQSDGPAGPAEVTLFVNENGPRYPSPVPTVGLTPSSGLGDILGSYDAILYNIGNNIENHGDILSNMRSVPGIGIMHDYSYQHLLAYLCFERARSRELYAKLAYDWGGRASLSTAISSGISTNGHTHYAPWDSDAVAELTFSVPIARLCSALVVHSQFSYDSLRPHFDGPIARLFLPWDQKPSLSLSEIQKWRKRTIRQSQCTFVIFGHIARAKQIDIVIQAFARSTILRECKMIIAGFPGDVQYLGELQYSVKAQGLESNIQFELGVTDERLLEIKHAGDVFVNLRWPNTEGSSGSLVEQLNTGRPVVVYNSGCYAEPPENAVCRVEREAGLDQLTEQLESLARSPARRLEIGGQALQWIRERGGREYVDSLKIFIDENRHKLKERVKFRSPSRSSVVPIKDNSWKTEKNWLANLFDARVAFHALDLSLFASDPKLIYIWDDESYIDFVTHVMLETSFDVRNRDFILDVYIRRGRTEFHRLVVLLYRMMTADKDDFDIRDIPYPDIDFWTIVSCLAPDYQVRCLYIGILERVPDESETTFWREVLQRADAFASVATQFLMSDERRLKDKRLDLDALVAWLNEREAARSALRPQRIMPELAEGHIVDFSERNLESGGYLLGEWHHPEQDGAWSAAKVGRIGFRTSAAGHFSGRLRVILPGQVGETGTFRLRAGSTWLYDGVLLASQPHDLPFAFDHYGNEPVILEFSTKYDYRPSLYEGGEDDRWLGVKLSELELLEIRAPQDEAPAGVEAGVAPAQPDETPSTLAGDSAPTVAPSKSVSQRPPVRRRASKTAADRASLRGSKKKAQHRTVDQ